MGILLACMSIYYIYAWYLQMSEKGMRSPRTGVIDAGSHLNPSAISPVPHHAFVVKDLGMVKTSSLLYHFYIPNK